MPAMRRCRSRPTTSRAFVRRNSRGEMELSVRGSDSRQAAVLMDGVPLTLGWDHRADPSLVPLGGVERITLVRGLQSLLHGPNVLGESLTYGWGPTMYTYPVPGTTRCEVVWGFRPSASMPLLWGAITAARKAGSKLIVVDPERTH